MVWSKSQQIALAIMPKIASVLSMSGSSWIIIEVWSDKNKLMNVYHRLLMVMAIYEIMEGVGNFASTWPIPAGTPNIFGASGTTGTCAAQGFFLQLTLATPIYNSCLSIYYLLVINYKMSEETLRERVEPLMHLTAASMGFGTATSALVLKLFNSANLWCWIAPFPSNCLDSWRYGNERPCSRGDNAWIFRYMFYFAPLWFCISLSIINTAFVYRKVHKREKKVRRHYKHASSVQMMAPALKGSTANEMIGHVRALSESGSVSDPEGERLQVDHSLDEEIPGSHQARRISSTLENRLREIEIQTTTIKAPIKNPRTHEVYLQAIWFLASFCGAHLFSTCNRIIQQVHGKTFFVLLLFHSFFDPFQGFMNFLVYRRPQYMRYRNRYPERPRSEAVKNALRWSFMDDAPNSRNTSIIRDGTRRKMGGIQMWLSLTLSVFRSKPQDGATRSPPSSSRLGSAAEGTAPPLPLAGEDYTPLSQEDLRLVDDGVYSDAEALSRVLDYDPQETYGCHNWIVYAEPIDNIISQPPMQDMYKKLDAFRNSDEVPQEVDRTFPRDHLSKSQDVKEGNWECEILPTINDDESSVSTALDEGSMWTGRNTAGQQDPVREQSAVFLVSLGTTSSEPMVEGMTKQSGTWTNIERYSEATPHEDRFEIDKESPCRDTAFNSTSSAVATQPIMSEAALDDIPTHDSGSEWSFSEYEVGIHGCLQTMRRQSTAAVHSASDALPQRESSLMTPTEKSETASSGCGAQSDIDDVGSEWSYEVK